MDDEATRDLLEIARMQISVASDLGRSANGNGAAVRGLLHALIVVLDDLEARNPGIKARAIDAFASGHAEFMAEVTGQGDTPD